MTQSVGRWKPIFAGEAAAWRRDGQRACWSLCRRRRRDTDHVALRTSSTSTTTDQAKGIGGALLDRRTSTDLPRQAAAVQLDGRRSTADGEPIRSDGHVGVNWPAGVSLCSDRRKIQLRSAGRQLTDSWRHGQSAVSLAWTLNSPLFRLTPLTEQFCKPTTRNAIF